MLRTDSVVQIECEAGSAILAFFVEYLLHVTGVQTESTAGAANVASTKAPDLHDLTTKLPERMVADQPRQAVTTTRIPSSASSARAMAVSAASS